MKNITAKIIIINNIAGLIFPPEEGEDGGDGALGVVSLWKKLWFVEDDQEDEEDGREYIPSLCLISN